MRTFVAAYHGTCGGCGDRIEPDDECTYVQVTPGVEHVWHAACATATPRVDVAHPKVCPTCHETVPCWCEDTSWAS